MPMKPARLHLSTLQYQVQNKLPLPIQYILTVVLTHTRDPQPEETLISLQPATGSQSFSLGWLPILTLTSALGMFSVSFAYTSSRNGAPWVEIFFWLGLLLIFVPPMVRHLSPTTPRFERIGLLCVVGICLYLASIGLSPLYFTSYDTFLHWRTADNIIQSRHLFSENALLPVSPFYPGLEIITTAFSTLSGLSIFHTSIIVMGLVRVLTVLLLFLLYEKVTSSARTAGIATALFMTNRLFFGFDSHFAYAPLALALILLVFFILVHHEKHEHTNHWLIVVTCLIIGAIVVTHHVTSFILDGLLILWTMIYGLQHPTAVLRSRLTKITLFCLITSTAWVTLKSNPVIEYLFPFVDDVLNEIKHILTGASGGRQLFHIGVQQTPLFERLMQISAIVCILLCLPFGLCCLWQRYRSMPFVCMLGVTSLFYPLSLGLLFTSSGYELSDRPASFLFISIAFVLAIFVVQFWPTRLLNWKQTLLITFAISVMFLGGIARQTWILLPGSYMATVDNRAITPEGIQTARWAYTYLGSNNHVATDLTDELLMSTYGDQYIVTKYDVELAFFTLSLNSDNVASLHSEIRYLIVDLRLAEVPSGQVSYFGEEPNGHSTSISLRNLTKFNTVPQINRVFDSGNIVIYDMGELIHAPEKP